MLDFVIPDLTIKGMLLGPHAEEIDLRFLLYQGGADLDRRWGKWKLESGLLGKPLMNRLPFLMAIHDRMQVAITNKIRSDESIKSEWGTLKDIMRFADCTNAPLAIEIEGLTFFYLNWAAKVATRSTLKPYSKYSLSFSGAGIIASVIGGDKRRLQWKTKLRHPGKRWIEGAKENLEVTQVFVHTLLSVVDQLTESVIRGPLPVTLRFEDGADYNIFCGPPLLSPECFAGSKPHEIRRKMQTRERLSRETSNTKRSHLINMRIEAELLVFINQTGGNLTQSLQLTGTDFRYRTDGDYLVINVHKRRAKHNVELRIYKAYRLHLENYLKWRNAIFPDDRDGLTFPFVYNDGEKGTSRTSWHFKYIGNLMKKIGQPFISPRKLRATIGNFINRKLSRQVAAEVLSNSEKTFAEHYEEPNHQRSVSELTSFWVDVQSIVETFDLAIGPGRCQKAEPKKIEDAPNSAPQPDCESAGGCIFCNKNRDLRTFDHVWNLASLHHLKLVEFNTDRTPLSLKEEHPTALLVRRIAEKLEAITREGSDCADWVVEARLRVEEGRYHAFYTDVFEILGCAK